MNMLQVKGRLSNLNNDLTQIDQDEKIQYLQMIQEPINRMSSASVIFKGFLVTCISIICNNIKIQVLCLLAILLIAMFAMDIYYLRMERQFRYLYKCVQNGVYAIDFSMKLNKNEIKKANATVWQCIKSPSIYIFYLLVLIFYVLLIYFKFKGWC